MASSDTIAAIATASGRAAIGIVRVSGSALAPLVEKLAGRRLPPRRPALCEFRDADGTLIDRGFGIHFPAPRSYTGEDVLEIHGHGGPVVLRLLLQRCLQLGARVAQPGEFTQRAFLNEKLDLAQAESVIDLIDATTTRAARCAARSLSGVFSSNIQLLIDNVVDLRARIEAVLDFPDEDVAVGGMSIKSELSRLDRQLAATLDASRQGSLLRDGVDVVLAGQPNVGKSSLLNRLAGEELAIVTDVPGTTRDIIRQTIEVEGIPIRIIDTAGLRSAADAVERIGVERTWEVIGRADLIVMMMDARLGESASDHAILARMPAQLPCLRVMNKTDLTAIAPHVEQADKTTRVWLSALTGEGIPLLRKALLQAIGWRGDSEEGLYLARERHLQALGGARAHLNEARDRSGEYELVAEALRLVQRRLSEITGEFTADDLLGEIFSRFCIGK